MFAMTILTLLILGVLKPSVGRDSNGSTYCEFYNGKACTNSEQGCLEVEKCISDDPFARNHCFVTWHFNNSTNETTVKQKGCFLDGKECYDKAECVDESEFRKKNVFFCCCSGDMCNEKFKWNPERTKPAQVIEAEVTSHADQDEVTTVLLSLSVPALVLIVLWTMYECLKRRNSKNCLAPESKQDSKSSINQCLGSIQLLEIKARGNFGAVWKARMANNVVAAKVFPTQQEQSWQTEQEVFNLPQMNHRDLLEFIGVEKRDGALQTELWLITAYHERGSLCNYLKENVLSWRELCKITESMLRGLMHLHEEIPANKVAAFKPAVAHRDFKSQNILLKADMSACIADFGLSLIFHHDKTAGNTHGQVGTRRYMAPEVLQGAINFNRDSFLRIDMYACSLVLWELVTRCKVQDVSVEEYRLPFQDQVGHNPTLYDMLKIVVHKGERPQILTTWRNHPGLLSLCDTIEECWDSDPEARLSASCVLERVLSIIKTQVKSSSTALWIEENNTSINAKESNILGEKKLIARTGEACLVK